VVPASRSTASFGKNNSWLKHAEFDAQKGEIRIDQTDWILMEGIVLRNLIEAIELTLKSGAVPILFEAGRYAGRNFAATLITRGVTPKEIPKFLRTFLVQGGWGKIQIEINHNEKTAKVTIDNCVTARQTQSKEPNCHLIRGYIAGISDVVFNTITECVETRCLTNGNPVCEFEVHDSSKTLGT
jgi:predicted hydrocarbon binding protein